MVSYQTLVIDPVRLDYVCIVSGKLPHSVTGIARLDSVCIVSGELPHSEAGTVRLYSVCIVSGSLPNCHWHCEAGLCLHS